MPPSPCCPRCTVKHNARTTIVFTTGPYTRFHFMPSLPPRRLQAVLTTLGAQINAFAADGYPQTNCSHERLQYLHTGSERDEIRCAQRRLWILPARHTGGSVVGGTGVPLYRMPLTDDGISVPVPHYPVLRRHSCSLSAGTEVVCHANYMHGGF